MARIHRLLWHSTYQKSSIHTQACISAASKLIFLPSPDILLQTSIGQKRCHSDDSWMKWWCDFLCWTKNCKRKHKSTGKNHISKLKKYIIALFEIYRKYPRPIPMCSFYYKVCQIPILGRLTITYPWKSKNHMCVGKSYFAQHFS